MIYYKWEKEYGLEYTEAPPSPPPPPPKKKFLSSSRLFHFGVNVT